MKKNIRQKFLAAVLLMVCFPVFAGSINFGLNLELVNGDFSENAFDGGLGFQIGYEFNKKEDWDFGLLFEFVNGINKEQNLYNAGEMIYSSRSLFATARPKEWPIMFKAGIVNADYNVLLQDLTQNFRSVSSFGYSYGLTLGQGKKDFRINWLDIKKVHIGRDSFTSFGISVAILGH